MINNYELLANVPPKVPKLKSAWPKQFVTKNPSRQVVGAEEVGFDTKPAKVFFEQPTPAWWMVLALLGGVGLGAAIILTRPAKPKSPAPGYRTVLRRMHEYGFPVRRGRPRIALSPNVPAPLTARAMHQFLLGQTADPSQRFLTIDAKNDTLSIMGDDEKAALASRPPAPTPAPLALQSPTETLHGVLGR